jgi:hypothetical protein
VQSARPIPEIARAPCREAEPSAHHVSLISLPMMTDPAIMRSLSLGSCLALLGLLEVSEAYLSLARSPGLCSPISPARGRSCVSRGRSLAMGAVEEEERKPKAARERKEVRRIL